MKERLKKRERGPGFAGRLETLEEYLGRGGAVVRCQPAPRPGWMDAAPRLRGYGLDSSGSRRRVTVGGQGSVGESGQGRMASTVPYGGA